jgi:hypothetical protein
MIGIVGGFFNRLHDIFVFRAVELTPEVDVVEFPRLILFKTVYNLHAFMKLTKNIYKKNYARK